MRSRPTKRKAPISKKSCAVKASEIMPSSDSDEADNEQKPAKKAKQELPQLQPTLNVTDSVISASDSDETGDEHMVKPEPMSTDSKQLSKEAPPSSSTSAKPTTVKARFPRRTDKYIQDSSDEEVDEANQNTSSNASTTSNRKFRESVIKRNHLVGNRLSFRRRGEYDESKPPAVNLSKRLNDSFLPNVQEDIFVSDSDSEPDSGVDYETFDFPSWQRTLTWNRKPEEDPWPKQRRFGYSDKLKLEKRIKKICKVSATILDLQDVCRLIQLNSVKI